jgi:GNAT superfamily N-acetyltransferase
MTSPTLNFETLSPDVYDRAKSVLNKAKHPGFVGRELFFRCATRGKAVVAVLDGIDVGVALISEADKLQALSVIVKAQGKGIGAALVRHLSPKYVSALGEKTDWFARLGYQAKGSPRVGKDLQHTVQLMERTDDVAIVERVERTDDVAIVEPKEETAAERKKREAREQAEAIRRRTDDLTGLSMLDLVPALSDHFRRPTHLQKWCELIETASFDAVRALCSVPIRHWKTETTVAGIIYLLLRHPDWRIIFFTHSLEAAQKWGKRIRQVAESTTVGPIPGFDLIAEWRNRAGGGVVVMSAEQSKIGYDCDALIVDDPIDEHGAEDPAVRERVDEAISLYTARCIKSGKRGPVLIVASRFHPDDPIGRRLLRTAVAWVYVQNAALVDEGLPTERAFAPDVWPVEELRKVRAELYERDPSERIWWAQFQNDPKPIGADLFREPTHYESLPDWKFRIAYGADLSFSQGDYSDYFAMVAMKIFGRHAYVIEVQRHKLDVRMLESTCKAMLGRHGHGPIYSYMSGPEIGTAQLMRERGLPFVILRARWNKLVRAQRTVKRWNDGEIGVPAHPGPPWLKGFLHRLSCFRGNDKDEGDDETDALVSVSDGAMGGVAAGGGPRTLRPAYTGFGVR